MITHMREPIHLSTNSNGSNVDGFVVVDGATAIVRLTIIINQIMICVNKVCSQRYIE